jgi:hypothetical protein
MVPLVSRINRPIGQSIGGNEASDNMFFKRIRFMQQDSGWSEGNANKQALV